MLLSNRRPVRYPLTSGPVAAAAAALAGPLLIDGVAETFC